MRRKRLNHYADAVCKMFMGWRMQDDLEILAELPNGRLTIDLLSCGAVHDSEGAVDLHIADEIQAWLEAECEKEAILFDQLDRAELVVDIDTSRVKTDKKRIVCFAFECKSVIETDEHQYFATAKETHKWYNRINP
ncbi:MAG: hypothetical protein HN350_17620 [Phycisphaerales bacterium]|jgi:hypothetical protein|nr:hypothetical protein [Phycisphaerales bacterium]